MTSTIRPVILSGGSGTRLWPRSRPGCPKPFLPLIGGRTLFQQALDRVNDTAQFGPAVIVAGEDHVVHIVEQAADQPVELIVEPCARNTAPAIALAAHRLSPDAVMLVCPSDHYIADTEAFVDAVRAAAALARDGNLVSLGITPDHPETGYGYILRGTPLNGGYKVDRFVEKPDSETAAFFVKDGSYSWNGGIFAFTAGTYLEELAKFRPELARLVASAVQAGSSSGNVFCPAASPFAQIAGESIDYAVMENTQRAAVVPVTMGWSDIGSWKSLFDARDGRSRGMHELIDCTRVAVDTDGPRVSVIGLEDVIVVVDGDEVLVTSSRSAQKVGQLGGAKGK